MRARVLLWVVTILFWIPAVPVGAEPLRLHVQPSRPEVFGDGDDRVTLTISARDDEGEVRTDLSGVVRVSINAGRLSEVEPRMNQGVAVVELTAPILDDQNKVFQRSIQLTQKIMEGIQVLVQEGPPGSPEDLQERIRKMATAAGREGPSASGMTSVDGSRPEVLVTAEFQGVQGKATLPVRQVPQEALGSMEGYFRGRDMTGMTEWTMELTRAGGNLQGKLFQVGAPDEVAVSSLGEAKAGWEVIYLADARELESMRKLHPRFLGMPTLLRALPGRTLYMFAPPVYFWPAPPPTSDEAAEPEEPEPTESVSVVPRKNLLPADGKSRTEVVFRYLDPQGKPVPDMKVEFRVGRGQEGKILSQQGRTDARGMARAVFQAPLRKTENLQVLGTCRRTDLYVTFHRDGTTSEAWGQVGVLTVADVELVVKKPGFDEFRQPMHLVSPRGRVQGRLVAKAQERNIVVTNHEIPVAHAECHLEGPVLKGITMKATTDESGVLDLELHFKEWPVAWRHKPELPAVPFSADFQARSKLLYGELFRFDEGFGRRARAWQFRTEKDLCSAKTERAQALEDQHRLLGGLLSSFRLTLKLTEDTGKEFLGHGWGLLGATASWANSRWKFTEGLEKHLGQANENLEQLLGLRQDKVGVRKLIYRKMQALFSNGKYSGNKTTVLIMDSLNQKVFAVLQQFLNDLAGELEFIKDFENPVPDTIIRGVQKGFVRRIQAELDTFLTHDPESVAPVADWTQRRVLDRSTELRTHYLSIAGWRLAVEEAKAVKDLVVDLSQAVAIAFAATGNVAVYQAWTKLQKVSEALDKAYTVTGFLAEGWNYCQLEAECMEIFKLTNRAISSGTMAHVSWPASPAWAEGPALADPPDLKLAVQGLSGPEALTRAIRARHAWRAWEEEADQTTWRLVASGSEAGREMPGQSLAFEDAVLGLMVAAAENRDLAEAARQLEKCSQNLDATARQATKDARSLPPQVQDSSRPLVLREPIQRWEWVAGGLSAGWLGLLGLLAAWRIRRALRS